MIREVKNEQAAEMTGQDQGGLYCLIADSSCELRPLASSWALDCTIWQWTGRYGQVQHGFATDVDASRRLDWQISHKFSVP